MHKILSLGALTCSPPTFNTILNDVCFILLFVAAVANVPPLSKCIVSRRHFVKSILHLLTVYRTSLMVNVCKTKSFDLCRHFWLHMFLSEVGMASNFIDTLFANGHVRLLIPSGICYVVGWSSNGQCTVALQEMFMALICEFLFCCPICEKRPNKRSLINKKRNNSSCYSGSSCRETECWWLLQSVRPCHNHLRHLVSLYIYIYIYI